MSEFKSCNACRWSGRSADEYFNFICKHPRVEEREVSRVTGKTTIHHPYCEWERQSWAFPWTARCGSQGKNYEDL